MLSALLLFAAAIGSNPADYRDTCTAVAVYDGDGPIHCREGMKIRLDGIAAREMNGECRRGHPCPMASGEAARDQLVNLLGGATGRRSTGHITIRPIRLRCAFNGKSYDRVTAWCVTPSGVDLSCAMIASGKALRWDRYWRAHRCPG